MFSDILICFPSLRCPCSVIVFSPPPITAFALLIALGFLFAVFLAVAIAIIIAISSRYYYV